MVLPWKYFLNRHYHKIKQFQDMFAFNNLLQKFKPCRTISVRLLFFFFTKTCREKWVYKLCKYKVWKKRQYNLQVIMKWWVYEFLRTIKEKNTSVTANCVRGVKCTEYFGYFAGSFECVFKLWVVFLYSVSYFYYFGWCSLKVVKFEVSSVVYKITLYKHTYTHTHTPEHILVLIHIELWSNS